MPIFDMIDVFILSEKGIENKRKNASIHKTLNPSFIVINETCSLHSIIQRNFHKFLWN